MDIEKKCNRVTTQRGKRRLAACRAPSVEHIPTRSISFGHLKILIELYGFEELILFYATDYINNGRLSMELKLIKQWERPSMSKNPMIITLFYLLVVRIESVTV